MASDTQWIVNRLDALEGREGIRILFACESGSRAWGFPSKDSDYDVRFVFLHPYETYLSLKPERETIDILDGDFDAGGWDLRKALSLMRGGNVPILEWIFSPIMYRQDAVILSSVRDLARKAFLPHRAVYHYVAMSRKKLHELDEGKATLKVAFYALRAALCAHHIAERREIAPVAIDPLLEEYLTSADRLAINQWRDAKARGEESDRFEDVTYWRQLCMRHLSLAEDQMPEKRDKADFADFDSLLMALLEK